LSIIPITIIINRAASLGLGPANAVAGAPQQQQQQVVMGGGGVEEEEEDEMEEVEYRELQGKPRDIVPAPRYPTVAFDLKPKVPRAVRQAVLDKFLEETLRKHHFLHFALDSCTFPLLPPLFFLVPPSCSHAHDTHDTRHTT
jgi:hypothetical protein